MADRKLKKLSRGRLLELMIRQEEEIRRLNGELEAARRELEDRRIRAGEAGSIAEAALSLNRVFEAAQAAADQYLESVKAGAEGQK